MALDRLDVVTLASIMVLVGLSPQVTRPVLAAVLGGLFCSLSIWRLYGGRPWEALAWLVWTGAAIALVVLPHGPIAIVGVLALIVLGTGLLVVGRLSMVP